MALIVAKVDEVAAALPYKFTDAACNTAVPPNIYDDVRDLENVVKWDLFDDGSIKGAIPEIGYSGSTKYCSDSDKDPRYHNRKKDRMAEFMIFERFPMSFCTAIITKTPVHAANISNAVRSNRLPIPVFCKPDCFF